MQFKTMTVRARLALSFGTLAGLIAVAAAMSIHALHNSALGFADYVQGVNARLLLSYEMRTAVEKRAIAARDLINAASPQDIQAILAEVKKAHADVQAHLASLKQRAGEEGVSPEARRLIATIADVEERYAPVALGIVELGVQGKLTEAVARMNADCRPLLAALINAAQAFRDHTRQQSDELLAQATAADRWNQQLLILVSLTAFAAAALAGVLITRSLTSALGAEPSALGDVARRVAQGDLSAVAGASAAPAGSVLASLGEMQHSLSNMVGQVRNSSDSIATGTSQIASGNTDLSQRTETQASNLQQTAASMEELAGTVKASADIAQQARLLASQAADAARIGGDKVGHVVGTMQEIAQSSRKIADIIGVIDSIAFQTNILALNAAVEAARAGEQGRGFAVVASEVRNLAHRSAEAAKEIKGLIGASVDRVEAGTRQVDEAGSSVRAIVAQAQRVNEMINELSNAAAEQATGIAQVGNAVQQLDHVTQQNAALVEETAAAADSLRHQAEELTRTMRQFKLAGAAAGVC